MIRVVCFVLLLGVLSCDDTVPNKSFYGDVNDGDVMTFYELRTKSEQYKTVYNEVSDGKFLCQVMQGGNILNQYEESFLSNGIKRNNYKLFFGNDTIVPEITKDNHFLFSKLDSGQVVQKYLSYSIGDSVHVTKNTYSSYEGVSSKNVNGKIYNCLKVKNTVLIEQEIEGSGSNEIEQLEFEWYADGVGLVLIESIMNPKDGRGDTLSYYVVRS